LAASVREFNELAVPGIGNVWFAKQLVLALVGLRVAHELDGEVSNADVTNAIEALACWMEYRHDANARDTRLRGRTKLAHVDSVSFRQARQRGFYVAQPMRVATVQALPALGLVNIGAARFNSMEISDFGIELVEQACAPYSPSRSKKVVDALVRWVRGTSKPPGHKSELRDALSPIRPLPEAARELLRERLHHGGRQESGNDKQRRRNALAWVQAIGSGTPAPVSWTAPPSQIKDQAHWNDLHAGAMFLATRSAALSALDHLEVQMVDHQPTPLDRPVSAGMADRYVALAEAARRFLDTGHADPEARRFCRECSDADPVAVLRSLVGRDGRVLRLEGKIVHPGAAFRGRVGVADENDAEEVDDGPEAVTASAVAWPEGISNRVPNLLALHLDLDGQYENWRAAQVAGTLQ
jgi:hypothetical protein